MRKKHRIPGESPAANPQAGVALLLAVVFIALLSAMVFSFLYEMEVDAVFVQNQGADFQARVAANSAVVNGMMVLAEQYASMLESGMPPVDSEVDGSQWHLGAAFEPLNEATMRTSIADEFGKINLNALLVYENGQPTRNDPLVNALREFFLLRDDSGYDPVDAIIDWLDYNDGDAEEPEGAESDFYQGLENPYSCKNGPMTSIEELLLIRGITPEL
ncbi:MAG TPA: type II secretion system protein GspK, partial [Candidatus Hydrogenedentes bacterium]|nr:type II secretion system protein GspK [Candidatus Hydrogenedentota bacterium]